MLLRRLSTIEVCSFHRARESKGCTNASKDGEGYIENHHYESRCVNEWNRD